MPGDREPFEPIEVVISSKLFNQMFVGYISRISRQKLLYQIPNSLKSLIYYYKSVL